jgi:hypothetical protein
MVNYTPEINFTISGVGEGMGKIAKKNQLKVIGVKAGL